MPSQNYDRSFDDFQLDAARKLVRIVLDAPFAFDDDSDPLSLDTLHRALSTCFALNVALAREWHKLSADEAVRFADEQNEAVHVALTEWHREQQRDDARDDDARDERDADDCADDACTDDDRAQFAQTRQDDAIERTITKLAQRAASGDADADAKLDALHVAELRSLDPSEFDGDAENGPRTPMTSVDRARREAASLLRAAATRAELDKLSASTITDDALFDIARKCDVSPLYVLRTAAERSLTTATSADEVRVLDRMRANERA